MATLQLAAGNSRSWSATALNGIIANLRLANQARSYSDGIAFMNAGFGLLIVDASWNVGLRLSEQYEARPASTFRFGIGFALDDLLLDVDAALAGAGYSRPMPISSLASAYMTFYDIGGGAYVTTPNGTGVSLVHTSGVFGTEPASIKRLVAGGGITLTQSSDGLIVTAPAPAPPDLSGYVPLTTYNPFANDVTQNAVFRRLDAITQSRVLTRLSSLVQLVVDNECRAADADELSDHFG